MTVEWVCGWKWRVRVWIMAVSLRERRRRTIGGQVGKRSGERTVWCSFAYKMFHTTSVMWCQFYQNRCAENPCEDSKTEIQLSGLSIGWFDPSLLVSTIWTTKLLYHVFKINFPLTSHYDSHGWFIWPGLLYLRLLHNRTEGAQQFARKRWRSISAACSTGRSLVCNLFLSDTAYSTSSVPSFFFHSYTHLCSGIRSTLAPNLSLSRGWAQTFVYLYADTITTKLNQSQLFWYSDPLDTRGWF